MYKHKHPNVSGSVKQIWFLHQCPVSAMLLSIEFHKMGANTLDRLKVLCLHVLLNCIKCAFLVVHGLGTV